MIYKVGDCVRRAENALRATGPRRFGRVPSKGGKAA